MILLVREVSHPRFQALIADHTKQRDPTTSNHMMIGDARALEKRLGLMFRFHKLLLIEIEEALKKNRQPSTDARVSLLRTKRDLFS